MIRTEEAMRRRRWEEFSDILTRIKGYIRRYDNSVVLEGVVSLKYIIIKIIVRKRRGRRRGRRRRSRRRIDTVIQILPLLYSDTRLYSTSNNNQNESDN